MMMTFKSKTFGFQHFIKLSAFYSYFIYFSDYYDRKFIIMSFNLFISCSLPYLSRNVREYAYQRLMDF